MKNFIFSPWGKILFPSIFSALIGFFSSTLANEVSTNGKIEWHMIIYKTSFYLVFASFLFYTLYVFWMTSINREKRAISKEDYDNQVRGGSLEFVIEYNNKLITSGELDKLEEANKKFVQIFGGKD